MISPSREGSRLARRARCDFNDAAGALNWLANRQDTGAKPNFDQQRVHARIIDLVADSMPPLETAIPSPRAAFNELLHGRGVYDESAGRNIGRLRNVGQISLPKTAVEGPRLIQIAPAHARQHLEDGSSRMLVPSDEFDHRLDSCDVIPHWDPSLARNRRLHMRFIRLLRPKGMFVFLDESERREEVGVSAAKKSDQLRMILSGYFCTRPVLAGEVGLAGTGLGGRRLEADARLVPACAALPMGFTWSLFFCQEAGGSMMSDTPELAGVPQISDRGPTAVLQPARPLDHGGGAQYTYVDNLGVMGFDAAAVADCLGATTTRFNQAGLALSTRLTAKRYWRVRQGLSWALSCRALPGWAREVVIGHYTYCAMCNRDLLPAFTAVYKFIAANYSQGAALWASARAELVAFRGLMPLLRGDWALPWSELACLSDASEHGSDRFRRLGGHSARAHFFAVNRNAMTLGGALKPVSELEEGDAVAGDAEWGVNPAFEEMPAGIFMGALWAVALCLALNKRLHARWVPSELNPKHMSIIIKHMSAIVQHMKRNIIEHMKQSITEHMNRGLFGPMAQDFQQQPQLAEHRGHARLEALLLRQGPWQLPPQAPRARRALMSQRQRRLRPDSDDGAPAPERPERRAERSRALSPSVLPPPLAPPPGAASALQRRRALGPPLGLAARLLRPPPIARAEGKESGATTDPEDEKKASSRLVVDSEVDAALVHYINGLFKEKHGENRGDVLLSALLHFQPQYGKLGSWRLPRAWRALKGWRRRCGRRSRNPVVRTIWPAVTWDLCCRGLKLMGPHVAGNIVTHRRPSEPLTTQRRDLVKPVKGGADEWSGILFPGSRAAPRRNEMQDEGMSLANKLHPWLPRVVSSLAPGAPESRLSPHSYPELVAEFNRTQARLGHRSLVLYQGRHSGASLDLQGRHRDHLEFKKQGGWQCESSLKRYENAARSNPSASKLMPAHAAQFKKADAQLEALSFGRVAAQPFVPLCYAARLWDLKYGEISTFQTTVYFVRLKKTLLLGSSLEPR
ncbi:unnamed protein product, partial [Prorocentrum cordatum]